LTAIADHKGYAHNSQGLNATASIAACQAHAASGYLETDAHLKVATAFMN